MLGQIIFFLSQDKGILGFLSTILVFCAFFAYFLAPSKEDES